MIKTLFFDVGYTLVDEESVWLRRCKEQAATEEAKKLSVTAEDIYHEIEKVTIEGLPQYRTTPQDSVMIGDRIDNDTAPAQSLGMKGVWIKQGFGSLQTALAAANPPDYEVDNLIELLRIF